MRVKAWPCPLNVFLFSHLGNVEANNKTCSSRHADVSGRQQKHFLSLRLGKYSNWPASKMSSLY